MNQALINDTLELLKMIQQNPNSPLAKAWTQSGSPTSGITQYDLEAPAKKLYPVLTPLRNLIPRTSGKGGIQANWRAITGINTGLMRPGVGQGNRSGVMSTTTQDYIAVYKTLGIEDYVTYQADWAAEGFEDVKKDAVEGLLRGMMIAEETVMLGGNTSVALGTTPTPSLTGSTTGGSLPTQTESVICVALAFDGVYTGSVANGIQAAVSRTNADASTDTYGGGSAQKSANATVALTGPNASVSATVTAVKGACGYAWFWGLAGSEVLGAITTINSIVITAAATGTQTAASLPSSDNSINALVYDGVLSTCFKTGSNAYLATQATGTAGTGTPLTSDSNGGIVEINTMLKSMWDNYRLSPTTIWVNSQEQNNIFNKILTSSANSAQRVVLSTNEQGSLAGGGMVRSYLNRFTMDGAQEIPIKLHPNLPAGTILATTEKLPYPLSNVTNVLQMRMRRDYFQVDWPIKSLKLEYGIYSDGVLQNYFPPAFGIISNIANG